VVVGTIVFKYWIGDGVVVIATVFEYWTGVVVAGAGFW
jgi:hypothetical protein